VGAAGTQAYAFFDPADCLTHVRAVPTSDIGYAANCGRTGSGGAAGAAAVAERPLLGCDSNADSSDRDMPRYLTTGAMPSNARLSTARHSAIERGGLVNELKNHVSPVQLRPSAQTKTRQNFGDRARTSHAPGWHDHALCRRVGSEQQAGGGGRWHLWRSLHSS
jgi:hypothetical protein